MKFTKEELQGVVEALTDAKLHLAKNAGSP